MRHPLVVRAPLVLFLAFVFSCGDCDDEAGRSGSNSGGSDASNSQPSDAGDGSDASPDASPDAALDNGDECGIYSTFCNGECIPTSSDPDNCGGCGVVCAGNQVCSGGFCTDGCTGGLTACDRRCVDTAQDSDHCDGCGLACGDGQGCADGVCVDTVDIDFDAASCEGGGPVIDLGDVVVEERQCAASLAELTFRFGACSCTDFDINNNFDVDAFDSNLGPYVPGGLGGGIGANGGFAINDNATVSGTMWVAGQTGVDFGGVSSVGMRLLSGGNLRTNEEGSVGRDAFIDGQMDLNASYDVANVLHLPIGVQPPGNVTYGDLSNVDITVDEPCTECPPDNLIDVGAIVDAFADPANNDNALIGLDADLLNPAPDNPVRLDLPCGRYYLSGIDSGEPVTIVAHGNTALFIDGDVKSNNPLTITLTPDAQLDVFIAGDVDTNNEFKLGSPNYPALQRVYVGGPTGFMTNNAVTIGGYLYVVPGSIDTNNEVEIFGGLYSNEIVTNNDWRIHYDRRITTVGRECDDPDDPNDPNDPNDPPPTTSCSTVDDTCTTDGECCSPLTCVDGTCQLLDCVPPFGECTSSDQCCGATPCSSTTNGICVLQ